MSSPAIAATNLVVLPLSKATSTTSPRCSTPAYVTLPFPCSLCHTRTPRSKRPSFPKLYGRVADPTANGKAFRMLTVVDEYTRECLAIRVERKLGSTQVLETLGALFVSRAPPEHLRSDNGLSFVLTP